MKVMVVPTSKMHHNIAKDHWPCDSKTQEVFCVYLTNLKLVLLIYSHYSL